MAEWILGYPSGLDDAGSDDAGRVLIDEALIGDNLFTFATTTPKYDNFQLSIDSTFGGGVTTLTTTSSHVWVGSWSNDDFNKGTVTNKTSSQTSRLGKNSEVLDTDITGDPTWVITITGDVTDNFKANDICSINNGESAIKFNTDISQFNPERINLQLTSKDIGFRLPGFNREVNVAVGEKPDEFGFIWRLRGDSSNGVKHYARLLEFQAMKKLDFQGQAARPNFKRLCPQVLKMTDETAADNRYFIFHPESFIIVRDAKGTGENIIEVTLNGRSFWLPLVG